LDPLIKRLMFSATYQWPFRQTCGSVCIERTKGSPFVGMARRWRSGSICAFVREAHGRRARHRRGSASGTYPDEPCRAEDPEAQRPLWMMPCFATGGALIDRSGDLSDLPGIGRERCPPKAKVRSSNLLGRAIGLFGARFKRSPEAQACDSERGRSYILFPIGPILCGDFILGAFRSGV